MNKFATFAVLALAALAVSVSTYPTGGADEEEMTQAVFVTTDEEETAEIKKRSLNVFEDFCLNTRDLVLSDIKRQTNVKTSGVFNMLFNSAAEIAKEGLDVQRVATEKLGAQLANPEAAIESGDSEVDQIIANGQSHIQGESQPRSLLSAFKSAVSAVSTTVGSLVNQRINYLVSKANAGEVLNVLSIGCGQIARYEDQLRSELESYKAGLPEQWKSYTLDTIPCATATKIIRVEGICGLFHAAVEPVKKIIGAQ